MSRSYGTMALLVSGTIVVLLDVLGGLDPNRGKQNHEIQCRGIVLRCTGGGFGAWWGYQLR